MMKWSMERIRFGAGSAGIAIVALVIAGAQFIAPAAQFPIA